MSTDSTLPPTRSFLSRMTPGLPPKPQPSQTEAESVKAYLIAKGWDEASADQAAQKVSVQLATVPSDLAGLVGLGARMAVPFLVAKFIPGGGGLVRTGKQVVTNVLGQGAIGGVTRAIQTGDPGEGIGGLVQAGVEAVPGATVQGALGMALGPRKATVRAQQAIREFKDGLSPEVGTFLDETQPRQTLGSSKTIDAMMRVAGKKLDTMEAAVRTGLGTTRFQIPLPKTPSAPESAPPLFGPSGTPIKDPALQRLVQGAQRGSSLAPEPSLVSFDDVRTRIKTLREGAYETPRAQIAARRQANHLEDLLLAEMTQKGFGGLATQYRQAVTAHAKDMVGVRGIKWVQAQQRRPGGASPVDDPQLSSAMDHLVSRGMAQQARAMLAGAFFALKHPFLAAGEAIQAAKQAGKVVDVNKIKGPITPNFLQRLVPPTAGAAATGFFGGRGLQTGTGVEALNPALDDLTNAEQEIGATDTHVGDLDQAIKDLP